MSFHLVLIMTVYYLFTVHLFKVDVFFLIRPKRILGLCYVVVKVSNLIIETLHFCGLFIIFFKPIISLNFHRVLK